VKVLGITQARISSTRLPRKVLKQISGKTLLEYHLERALKSKLVNEWIVATTNELDSELICLIAGKMSLKYFKGNLYDVLDRFYNAAIEENPDYVVRITSDCPLIDPEIIDDVVNCCLSKNVDYASNTLNRTFPDGTDVEVFSLESLKTAWLQATEKDDREHVTPFIWRNSSFYGKSLFSAYNFQGEVDSSSYRITVDDEKDFKLIQQLIETMGSDRKWSEYIDFIKLHPELQK
jgi:spore coat polysaccharide biosynthesis protein SpsF